MDKKKDFEEIDKLIDGEYYYFNMREEGGAICYKCNGMYLLFEIPQYGGEEQYTNIYYENQINELIELAYSWI